MVRVDFSRVRKAIFNKHLLELPFPLTMTLRNIHFMYLESLPNYGIIANEIYCDYGLLYTEDENKAQVCMLIYRNLMKLFCNIL